MIGTNALPQTKSSSKVWRVVGIVGILSALFLGLIVMLAIPTTAKPQILEAIVIDDDSGNRKLFAAQLEYEGYLVHECIEYCDFPGATFILVDAFSSMRSFVGAEYIKLLRASHPSAIIIGISGNTYVDLDYLGQNLSVREHMLLAGATQVFEKPFDLFSIIQRYK